MVRGRASPSIETSPLLSSNSISSLQIRLLTLELTSPSLSMMFLLPHTSVQIWPSQKIRDESPVDEKAAPATNEGVPEHGDGDDSQSKRIQERKGGGGETERASQRKSSHNRRGNENGWPFQLSLPEGRIGDDTQDGRRNYRSGSNRSSRMM